MNTISPNPDDAGALTAYGEALSRILIMAMRPLQAQDPTAYMAIMSGVKDGYMLLKFITHVPINQPGRMTLYVTDAAGAEREIATLPLNPAAAN